MQVAFGVFRAEAIQHLRVAGCAERGNGQYLGFAALEKAGAMHARDQVHIC